MRRRILVIGNIYNGLYMDISSLPLLNGESRGTDFRYFPCGDTVTSAVAMSRYGADVVLCAKTGADTRAKTLISYLGQSGIETRYIKSDRNCKTGIVVHLNEENGNTRRIVFPMSNEKLSVGDIENAFTSYPDFVYIHDDMPNDLTSFIFTHAKNSQAAIFYHPMAKKPLISPASVPPLEALILDAAQVSAYCGIDANFYENLLHASMSLMSLYAGTKYIIIRIPERGTFIYDGKYHEIVKTFPSTDRYPSGAPSIFGAVMCAEYVRCENIRRSVCLGNIAYALSSNTPGDVKSAPAYDDIKRYLLKNEIEL